LKQYETAFRETHVNETVLPNLTVKDLKDLDVSSIEHRRKILDAIGLERADAKAKAALAILREFDEGLGRRKDDPAHPDHLDEAACRIP
jgi:hypothetical protein